MTILLWIRSHRNCLWWKRLLRFGDLRAPLGEELRSLGKRSNAQSVSGHSAPWKALRAKSQHTSRDCNRSAEVPAADVGEKPSACQHTEWYCKRNLANSPGQPSHAVVMKREIVTLLLLEVKEEIRNMYKVLSVPFSFYLTNVFRCKASNNIHLLGYFTDSSCG